jgi:DNA-binding NarL/FixJ family response regulator
MRPLSLKILVVDDHALMREAVRAIIEGADGMEVVGEAETSAQALRRTAELEPDVVLLDLRLPDVEGLGCLETLRREHPDTPVVVFSAVDDRDLIAAALARGAAGYVLKRISPLDLPAAIRQTVERNVFHQQDIAVDERPSGLSEKELEVLAQLTLGQSNREIAAALWLSDQTVKFHLSNVYRKLGASTRTEAIRIAHERALVPLPVAV